MWPVRNALAGTWALAPNLLSPIHPQAAALCGPQISCVCNGQTMFLEPVALTPLSGLESRAVKSLSSGRPEFGSFLCCFLALKAWTSHSPSLGLSFLPVTWAY